MDSSALKTSVFLFGVLIALVLCASAATSQAADFAGVGLQVVPIATGELVVLKVVEKGPAFAAGVRPGDLILAVDGHPLAGKDFAEVVTGHLWGPSGTEVTLEFLRPGVGGPHSATILRVPMEPQAIDTPGVKTILPE